MSTVNTIPLTDNTDVAELVADKHPGDRLYFCATIKALDEQSLTYRIEEVTDKIEDLPKPGEYDEDEDGEDEGNQEEDDGSTPGETEEADELAAPGGYAGP